MTIGGNLATASSADASRPAYIGQQSGSTQARISEKRREAEGEEENHGGLPFSIDLVDDERGNGTLPGCIHLLQAGLGQVVWRLEVRAEGRQTAASGESSLTGIEHVDSFDVHLTPCHRPDGRAYLSESEAGPSGTLSQETSSTVIGNLPHVAASACRMTLNMTDVVNTESVAVGVEISSDPRGMSEQSIKWLRGLRSVRIQWWRRVRVRPGEALEASGLSQQVGTLDSIDHRDSLTLLHKSGKLCRYSNNAERPIRLVFELPPLHNVISKNHNASSIGGVGCGDISQNTPLHSTEFFVRVIVESRGGGTSTPSQQASSSSATPSTSATLSEGDPVVLEHLIKILPPTWDQVMPYIVTSADRHTTSDTAAIARAIEDNGDLQDFSGDPHQADARHRAYRLKGSDIVGDTGTFRQETSGASGSGQPPPAFEAAASERLPWGTEETAVDPPPFAEIAGQSDEALPTFDESELSRQALPGTAAGRRNAEPTAGSSASRPSVLNPLQNPRPATRSGVLANWREYDGYETFSAPPPAASVSIGLSGSMDPPSSYDADAETSPGDTTLGGVNQRAMLLEQLGLGEGTRVIDTHEDMPPGFDEPSLPSLPNAVMPHHRRGILRRTALDEAGGETSQLPHHSESSPPPAFSPDANSRSEPVVQGTRRATEDNDRAVLPPPSFDASEAAEARGIAATGPEPVMLTVERAPISEPPPDLAYHTSNGMAPAPPVYTMGHQEAPPGYSRAR